jgi:hypothetical protein
VVITLIFLMSESDCRPDDGGSKLFWNVSQYQSDCLVQHPRRQLSSYLSPWESQISSLFRAVQNCLKGSTEILFHKRFCISLKAAVYKSLQWNTHVFQIYSLWFCILQWAWWLFVTDTSGFLHMSHKSHCGQNCSRTPLLHFWRNQLKMV